MAFTFQSDTIGATNITDVTSVVPGVSNLPGFVLEPQTGEVRQGWDPALGSGEFIYLRYSGTIVAGTVCEITPSLSGGNILLSATAWAGTANTGKPLCVAVAATGAVGQYGWFQVEGNAICTTAGAPAAGNSVFYGASAGTVRPTANAGAQVLGATYATAVSQTIGSGTTAVVLSATQAVVVLNRPHSQSAIT